MNPATDSPPPEKPMLPSVSQPAKPALSAPHPLRACELCRHSQRLTPDAPLYCTVARQVAQHAREPGEACGPGATQMDMEAWSPAA
ncbi:hypothetical protein P3G55_17420 [Leptospira sp. 96542]|nr:hypothetical protein [Leptospira sp. 96542]